VREDEFIKSPTHAISGPGCIHIGCHPGLWRCAGKTAGSFNFLSREKSARYAKKDLEIEGERIHQLAVLESEENVSYPGTDPVAGLEGRFIAGKWGQSEDPKAKNNQ